MPGFLCHETEGSVPSDAEGKLVMLSLWARIHLFFLGRQRRDAGGALSPPSGQRMNIGYNAQMASGMVLSPSRGNHALGCHRRAAKEM